MEIQIAVAASKKKVREQSGCIPYRINKKGVVEVCLLKKLKKDAWWGFAKGGLESHLTKRQNAAKECAEEGGVTGTVTKKLGSFKYRKDGMDQIVYMYAMKFHVELENWDEKKTRKRKWFTIPEARDKLSREHHKFLEAVKKIADKEKKK